MGSRIYVCDRCGHLEQRNTEEGQWCRHCGGRHLWEFEPDRYRDAQSHAAMITEQWTRRSG